MRVVLVVVFVANAFAQDKPAAPAVPFKDIAACVQASNCKNMTSGTINWFDVIGIPALTFTEGEWTYALSFDPGGRMNRPARVYIRLKPQDSRGFTHSLALDLNGQLASAELGPQPGEMVPSRTSYEEWKATHKAFATAVFHPSGAASGEEYKPFWQPLADQALAAIKRQISK